MKKCSLFLTIAVCLLSLSVMAGGVVETVTTSTSAATGATVTASTVYLKGTLEEVTFKCGTNTCTAILSTVPLNTAVPGYTLISTNVTGNVTVFPRVESQKPFLWGDSILATCTNIGASNATIQITYKVSQNLP